MIVAFAGTSGRADPSQAARLCAHALHEAGLDVALVLAGTGAVVAEQHTANLHILTVPADPLPAATAIAAASTGNSNRMVIADLPHELLTAPEIRGVVNVEILAVGPYASDERAALASLRRYGKGDPGQPGSTPVDRLPWMLGCRRGGGGPAASTFAATMLEAAATAGLDGIQILPVAMGPLTRPEDMALEAGCPARRNLRDGTVLALALNKVMSEPHRGGTVHPGFEARSDSERVTMTSDERSLPEKLHDLADDIDAILQGGGPSAADLANAPILDQWIHDVVPIPILKGVVSNHPGIATGRPVRTSEVFLTDNATFARTLSRYYVLRMPRAPGGPPSLQ